MKWAQIMQPNINILPLSGVIEGFSLSEAHISRQKTRVDIATVEMVTATQLLEINSK